MVTPLRCHGVLITFRRPDALATHLGVLASQTRPLATLIVVDNDDDPGVRGRVESASDAAGTITYLGLPTNLGPAGAIAVGIDDVLARAADDDWLVLLDDDDPPQRHTTLEALGDAVTAGAATDTRLGGVGLWGARLHRSGRLRAATGVEPEPVAYLPGGACPHYRVAALRDSGGPDPALFFGFDDLDLGLALRRAGWTLQSSGLAREHGWASMVEGRVASRRVTAPSWRRYYSLRNLVVVLRRDGRTGAAAAMSVVAGLAKPVVNLPLAPRAAASALVLNLRALSDGWTGRTGKLVDPLDLPGWLR